MKYTPVECIVFAGINPVLEPVLHALKLGMIAEIFEFVMPAFQIVEDCAVMVHQLLRHL
jgi:hypothetical protein